MRFGFFAGNDDFGAGSQIRVANQPGKIAQGIGDILHAIKTALKYG